MRRNAPSLRSRPTTARAVPLSRPVPRICRAGIEIGPPSAGGGYARVGRVRRARDFAQKQQGFGGRPPVSVRDAGAGFSVKRQVLGKKANRMPPRDSQEKVVILPGLSIGRVLAERADFIEHRAADHHGADGDEAVLQERFNGRPARRDAVLVPDSALRAGLINHLRIGMAQEELRVGAHKRDLALELFRAPRIIGIEERDQRAARRPDRLVPGRRTGAGIHRAADHPHARAVSRGDLHRAVR